MERSEQNAKAYAEFEVVEEPVSYERFYNEFLASNRACLLRFGTDKWQARQRWLSADKQDVNEEYFTSLDCQVPVALCDLPEFDSHRKVTMHIADFFRQWKIRPIYLKDWHFFRDIGNDVYEVPMYFRSDWLNEYWAVAYAGRDDYRFVYIGGASTWTPLHADVFRSFSWSANVIGLKRWVLFPPGSEEMLRLRNGQLPTDISHLANWSLYDSAAVQTSQSVVKLDLQLNNQGSNDCTVVCYLCYQQSGEILFVPSDWYHQVWNLRPTISINHNWLNASNINRFAKHLTESYRRVDKELSEWVDCKSMSTAEWLEQCALIARAECGMDMGDFGQFLLLILLRRLRCRPQWQQLFETLRPACNLHDDVFGAQYDSQTFCSDVVFSVFPPSDSTLFSDAGTYSAFIDCHLIRDISAIVDVVCFLINDPHSIVFLKPDDLQLLQRINKCLTEIALFLRST